MSWKWEYAFGAEQASHTAPSEFVVEVEKKVAELVRMCEAKYLDGALRQDASPRGGDITVPGECSGIKHPGHRRRSRRCGDPLLRDPFARHEREMPVAGA